jgi:hypothetical protein
MRQQAEGCVPCLDAKVKTEHAVEQQTGVKSTHAVFGMFDALDGATDGPSPIISSSSIAACDARVLDIPG